MAYEQELAVAQAAVSQAARLCEAVRQQLVMEAMEKADKSPVTVADYGAQALICRALAMAFPLDPVVGEEDASELRDPALGGQLQQILGFVQGELGATAATAEQVLTWIDQGNGAVGTRFWTLDPIDGTKGFLRRDQYAIALALIEDGDLRVGVMACPALKLECRPETGLLFSAVRGQGATVRPLADLSQVTPLQVLPPGDSPRLRFVESVEASHGNQPQQQAVARAAGITRPPVPMDSQAKYGVVAAGEAALYLRLPSPKYPDYREKIWDHAAGALIVEEAGGRVTDMLGQPLDFYRGIKMLDNRGVIATNGTLHDLALQAMAKGR